MSAIWLLLMANNANCIPLLMIGGFAYFTWVLERIAGTFLSDMIFFRYINSNFVALSVF